jgi:hypothetical protein
MDWGFSGLAVCFLGLVLGSFKGWFKVYFGLKFI